MSQEFEFERPIIELEKRLTDLKALSEEGHIDLSREISAIAQKIDAMRREIFGSLEPWQVTQVARHILRPSTLDYLNFLCEGTFIELHGDRLFSDDPAIVGGMGKIGDAPFMFIGHQKGHDTQENLFRNFGMPHPEGYRKSQRLLTMAERFNLPVVVFIDTPGAFPGIGAEERGQSEAIAHSICHMSRIKVPILCFIIGEGGSGGALAIGVGDRVYMLEYSVYSVITAEGCAAILWKDASKSKEASKAMRMRAQDLHSIGIIDGIIPEPLGGAHRDMKQTAEIIRDTILRETDTLSALPKHTLLARRYAKFRSMGKFHIQEDFNAGEKN